MKDQTITFVNGKKERDFLLGLDPSGGNTTGAALYYPRDKNLQLWTGTAQQVLEMAQNLVDMDRLVVVMEDPGKNSATFTAVEDIMASAWAAVQAQGKKKYQGQVKIMNEVEEKIRKWLKIAGDVRVNKEAAKNMKMALERLGVPVVTIAPSDRNRADKAKKNRLPVHALTMPTKTNREQFYDLTGYVGRSSEHSRDAATLVWDHTVKWAEIKYKTQNNGIGF